MSWTIAELAKRFGLQTVGNDSTRITGVATLDNAKAQDLSFLANPKYRSSLGHTQAGCVVMHRNQSSQYNGTALLSDNPYADFARIAHLFDTRPQAKPGVHETATIASTAVVHDSAAVGANVVIGAGSTIGADTCIQAGVVIHSHVQIGNDCHIGANGVIHHDVRIGDSVITHPGAVIGADGFGLAMTEDGWIKVPQLGGVRIGDRCEIGANTTIDRGALEDTVLESDVRIDNQVQIAHNVFIGEHTALAGCCAVAGSARIGRRCMIAGGVGILGHLSICDDVTVTAMSLVTHSLREPGVYSSGSPLQINREWRKNAVRFKKLDQMAQRLHKLERESE